MQSGTKKEREEAYGHSFDVSVSLSPPDHTLLAPLADVFFSVYTSLGSLLTGYENCDKRTKHN